MPVIPNDEPIYEDWLGHFPLVRHVGNMLRQCAPPYVLGVCGAWGSGKTSFLRKLWSYLGGPFDVAGSESQQRQLQRAQRRTWFGASYEEPPSPGRSNGWHVIWFNPWQHQFDDTPLIALLHEIRQHFSLTRKMWTSRSSTAHRLSIGRSRLRARRSMRCTPNGALCHGRRTRRRQPSQRGGCSHTEQPPAADCLQRPHVPRARFRQRLRRSVRP